MIAVVDASVALAWVLPGQRTPAATNLLSRATEFSAPALFAFEFRAGLWAAERRRSLSRAEVDREIATIFQLVTVAAPPDLDGHRNILELARRTGLSFYDATYLELALRTGAHLATRDGPLLAAAAALSASSYDAR